MEQERSAREDAREAVRFYYDQAIAAQRRMERLEAEIAHLRAALNRMRDLGHGMSRSWYVREIEDGLAFPPGDHEK